MRGSRIFVHLIGAVAVIALTTCTAAPSQSDGAPSVATVAAPAESRPAEVATPRPQPPGPLTGTDLPQRFSQPAGEPALDPSQPPEPAAEEAPPPTDAAAGGVDPSAPAPPEQVPEAVPGEVPVEAAAVAEPQRVAEPTRVLIPRIGVDHPMVGVGLHPDRTLVVPDRAHIAGWYTGAPRPGGTGPSIVTGHKSWKGERGVFWDLHRLAPGDVVAVRYDDGSAVRFLVERVEQHPKSDFPTERVYGNTPRREIRIITCGGVFDRQRREHVDNIIVFGVRVA